MLEDVLAVRRNKAEKEHPVIARFNLARQNMDAGHLDRAQAWFDIAVPRFAKAYGEDHPDYATVLVSYAQLIRKQSQPARAAAYAARRLAIRLAKLGEDHVATAASRYELGVVLLERAAYGEAEPLLLRAHDVRLKNLAWSTRRRERRPNSGQSLHRVG